MKTQTDFHIIVLFTLLVIGVGAFTRGFTSTKDVVVLANDGLPSTEELYKPLNFQHEVVTVQETKPSPVPTTTPVPRLSTKSLNDVQAYVKSQNDLYFGESHWKALYELLMRESGFKTTAQNKRSTAYGLFQFLDSTWKGVGCKRTGDLYEQVECGISYIITRYENPTKALEFHKRTGWY